MLARRVASGWTGCTRFEIADCRIVAGMKLWVLLVLATALIVTAVTPWGDFQGHTHWSKVGWVPFFSKPVRLRDILANILLFAPFGAVVSRFGRERSALMMAVIAGGCLSLLAETLQLYSHTRFPSATDLVSNILGAALGAALSGWWLARARRPAVRPIRAQRTPAADEGR
jgi:glycopeptide antibiotics resistance protein